MKMKEFWFSLCAVSLAGIIPLLVACGKPDNRELGGTPKREATVSAASQEFSSNSSEIDLVKKLKEIDQFPKPEKSGEHPRSTTRAFADPSDWRFQTLIDGHIRSGYASPPSFEAVSNAFRLYAEFSGGNVSIWTNLTKAITAAHLIGTSDPFIDYMVLRYQASETNGGAGLAISMINVVSRLQQSSHHPLFRFLAATRASEYAREADDKAPRGSLLNLTTSNLEDAARDGNMPQLQLYEAINLWMDFSTGSSWPARVMQNLEPILDEQWSGSAWYFEIKGRGEIGKAWKERGTGFADKVTPQMQGKFESHLASAQKHLEAAWSLDTNRIRVAHSMMSVELGQGMGRPRAELWFQRAMALNTNDYGACVAMSFYLEPRWYGDADDALVFARTCVASAKWGGRVPLVLRDVHKSLASYYKMANSDEYWRRPYVWADLRSSYEKFFKLNPNNVSYRHDYAADAFKCGQYEAFLDQLPKFKTGTNYIFFKGEAAFNQMVAEAKAKLRK